MDTIEFIFFIIAQIFCWGLILTVIAVVWYLCYVFAKDSTEEIQKNYIVIIKASVLCIVVLGILTLIFKTCDNSGFDESFIDSRRPDRF